MLSDQQEADRSALGAAAPPVSVEFRRYINPERNAPGRLCTLGRAWAASQAQDRLAQVIGALHGLAGTPRRASTNAPSCCRRKSPRGWRNLGYGFLMVLSVLTALLVLWARLLSGIFGMNMAGVPGLQAPGAFWWW